MSLVLGAVALLSVASGATAVAQCAGDCNDDGEVTVDEILVGVNVALESGLLSDRQVFDSNSDGEVTVDELLLAVNDALGECQLKIHGPTCPRTGSETRTG